MKNQSRYLQNLFYDFLNDYGRAFIVVKCSDRTTIGDRGFTEEEKKNGLILVFNNKNYKSLQWVEDGSIIATLGFGSGNKPENCFLHCDDIIAVYSPDAMVKLDRWDMFEVPIEEINKGQAFEKTSPAEGKIVSLNSFRKTKT